MLGHGEALAIGSNPAGVKRLGDRPVEDDEVDDVDGLLSEELTLFAVDKGERLRAAAGRWYD